MMKGFVRYAVAPLLAIVSAIILVTGCAVAPQPRVAVPVINYPQLPEPDMVLRIPGLGPCNDLEDRSVQLNSRHPVTVLIHGCKGSAGRFLNLSQVLAFHGQQSVCFSYDDRDSIMKSSRQLADAVEELAENLASPEITVMGHSQGGLVARKALVVERKDPIDTRARLNLVTISAPLSGIRAARICGMPILRIASLGINDLICWLISGDKWYEITYASDFIQKPGVLGAPVDRYLLVATDEEGSCRQFDDKGRCMEDDFVFTLDEQVLPQVDAGPAVNEVLVRAGHVEIVGSTGVRPEKLIKILQNQGFILATEPSRREAFNALISRLYDQ